MTRIALVGYASLDHPIQLDGVYRPHWTTPIRHRGGGAWPRAGGCHYYAALPIARAGMRPSLVTWIGDDEFGALYRRQCVAAGIADDGMAVVADGATPLCFLVYEDNGACACLIDFGMAGRETVTPEQEKVLTAADLVCLTVAPPAASRHALDLVRPDATLAWVTKNDPVSFPPRLRDTIADRSRIIFCNKRELAWVDEALGGAIGDRTIVETNGASEITVHRAQGEVTIPVSPVAVTDTTGAGDTLAGGTLAAIAAGETDIIAAVHAGAAAARDLLRQRTA
ncbi:carbohydrate kinase family protein [Sphingomonas sp.]|uniref:carbohydrate kinase family protein n=2 Tax=unclassified Sphingomonas TaxID=196159 RepID=UPI00257AA4FA|nr:carbohydrate kinase family protein [Sphingomonas sp.]